jgi:hypothetical protein
MENMSGRHSRGVRRLCSEAEGWAGLSLYSQWHLGRYFEDAETAHGTSCCLPRDVMIELVVC